MKIEIEREFSQTDYDRFAKLSGDFNPIHVDPVFSANSGFGKTVAHGIFLTTCLMGVLEKAIGEFALSHSKIMFPAPTFCGVTMSLSAEVDGKQAKLICREKQSGQETCVIEAIFAAPETLSNSIQFISELEQFPMPEAAVKPLFIGQSCEESRIFNAGDIAEFQSLGGNVVAQNQITPIFLNAMFSKLLGIDLPGLGTNYLKQETEYLSPAALGEKITAKVEITRIRADKKIVDFSTIAFGEDGRQLANGRALVSARDVKGAF